MGEVKFDEIGYWSEVKLEIVKKYATAYSTILTKQPGLHHIYIDGFAGAGVHISKTTGEFVLGSPLNALEIQPPFREFFLVDLNGDKVEHLRQLVGPRPDVHVLRGDCNKVLLEEVFPRVQWKDHRRALCLLDPYGIGLAWEAIATAGRMKTIDLFLNFQIMDANRNALWRNPEGVSPAQVARMTVAWGDDSWRTTLYRERPQLNLFGVEEEKLGNEEVAEAFRRRLREVGGFEHVPRPIPMRNSVRRVVYYLYFASQKGVAHDIVDSIFRKYETRGA